MNQDTATNVYDFSAREYGIQGRWPSPDSAGISSMHWQDPQTLNRYAYVRNSPLTTADPTGMDGCDVESGEECIVGMPAADSLGGGGGDPFGSWVGDASMSGGSTDLTGTAGYIPGGCMACLPNQDPSNSYLGTDQLGAYTGQQIITANTDAKDFSDGAIPRGFGGYYWQSAFTGAYHSENGGDWMWTGWSADQGDWELRTAADDSCELCFVLGQAGNLADAELKSAVIQMAIGDVLAAAGGYLSYDDAFQGINDNPLFRVGKGYSKEGKQIWRWASGGRWGKGGPKLPWHWHIP